MTILKMKNIPIQMENILIQAKQTVLQNVILEFLIGLQEKKPNGNMITCESIIMKRTNKTPQWRKKLTLE